MARLARCRQCREFASSCREIKFIIHGFLCVLCVLYVLCASVVNID